MAIFSIPFSPFSIWDIMGPAGAIYSTATDMGEWMKFHIRGGTVIYWKNKVIQKDPR